jgi:hypothetical protein
MSKTYRCSKCNAGNLESPACNQQDCDSTVYYEEHISDDVNSWLVACQAGETMNCIYCPHNNTIQCYGMD